MLSKKILLFLSLLTVWVAHPAPATNAWDMPPLLLPDLQGKQHNLYDWHGRVILLNFWASWCGPCQIELPHLVDYQKRYGGQGLQVIGIGLDDPAKLANVARTLNLPYPILHAPAKQAVTLLQQWGDRPGVLPYTVVIDRDGTMVFQRVGVFDDEAFELVVLPLLQSPVH
ncbi:MAG: hypothetical protein AXA67_13260 [Methylothermaceae bacteria B42]|nr:MAG: hypothetical protein AXA67_13260 [Methylothermaceae bacteria B42]HHJ38408.1 TlpA family protein disulfide reductase [Methylothermaceae bacterium]